jgi:hypothetical protein
MLSPADPFHASDQMTPLLQGQFVEVRCADEIAATLDSEGKLDGLPFMPEMASHCGRRFRVGRRADITCVEGHGLRRMDDAVFLEDVRCDGSAHDGCERSCLIFWKEAWLRPVAGIDSPSIADPTPRLGSTAAPACTPTKRDGQYLCQSTALAQATRDLPSWNLLPFASQMRDGELSPARFCLIIALALYNMMRKAVGLREVGRLRGERSRSSSEALRLQPGEWVRVKSCEAIEQTLDPNSRNRGLLFEPEMSEYANGLFQVDFAVTRMIQEETGQMIQPIRTVALKGLTCHGLCAKSCPRGNYWYWREDWLERIHPPISEAAACARGEATFANGSPAPQVADDMDERKKTDGFTTTAS